MNRKPVFSFDNTTSTGIDQVPVNGVILIEDDGSGPRQIVLTDKTGITGTTTIATLLDTMATQYVTLAAIPAGAIFSFPTVNAPSGFLECDGSALSRTTYASLFAVLGTTYGVGDGITTFNIPDLRGEFIRGFDNGRGVDVGRTIGSWQVDEFKEHTHQYRKGDGGDQNMGTGDQSYEEIIWGDTNPTGGSETRPRNIAMLYCIKY